MAFDGRHVAMLLQRLDGSWFARLIPERGVDAPLDLRDCQSFESGKAGIEAWVRRHEALLREGRHYRAEALSCEA